LSLSSMTEHSFHGIHFLPKKRKSVTYVSGTICYLCVGSLILPLSLIPARKSADTISIECPPAECQNNEGPSAGPRPFSALSEH